MNPMMASPGGLGQGAEGTNLFSILVNVAFGFVGGLMVFLGPREVIAYGTKLAGELMNLTGFGQQMGGFGFAATAAPYIILAPIGGLVIRELTSVRSLKRFAFFAAAVIAGFAVSYFSYERIATPLLSV